MVLLQLKLDIQIFNIIKVSRFDPGQREKINLDFVLILLCGASKGFTKHHKEVLKVKI